VLELASGGIVPGNSFSGDRVPAMMNSGEMAINREDQNALWDFVSGGSQGGGTRPLSITINLNSRPISHAVVEDINNRHELIMEGSVIR
jgi:hypothetical protein